MLVVAYFGGYPGSARYRIMGVVDTVAEASAILKRHNSRGSLGPGLERSLKAGEGIVVTGTKFVVVDMDSESMALMADGKKSRPSWQVGFTGVRDSDIVDIYHEALAWRRSLRIGQIL